MSNKKVKVTQCTIGTYTHQYRYWLNGMFLGMKEVFLGSVKTYPA